MITKKTAIHIFLLVILLIATSFLLGGCSTMSKQTPQDKFDHVIDQYLPENAEVVIYTSYDIKKNFGRKLAGNTKCGMQVIASQAPKCVISTVLDAEVLLHEICHVIEGEWHGNRSHGGLFGCKMFNYDTLAAL